MTTVQQSSSNDSTIYYLTQRKLVTVDIGFNLKIVLVINYKLKIFGKVVDKRCRPIVFNESTVVMFKNAYNFLFFQTLGNIQVRMHMLKILDTRLDKTEAQSLQKSQEYHLDL